MGKNDIFETPRIHENTYLYIYIYTERKNKIKSFYLNPNIVGTSRTGNNFARSLSLIKF